MILRMLALFFHYFNSLFFIHWKNVEVLGYRSVIRFLFLKGKKIAWN